MCVCSTRSKTELVGTWTMCVYVRACTCMCACVYLCVSLLTQLFLANHVFSFSLSTESRLSPTLSHRSTSPYSETSEDSTSGVKRKSHVVTPTSGLVGSVRAPPAAPSEEGSPKKKVRRPEVGLTNQWTTAKEYEEYEPCGQTCLTPGRALKLSPCVCSFPEMARHPHLKVLVSPLFVPLVLVSNFRGYAAACRDTGVNGALSTHRQSCSSPPKR